jgi:hypothetical protein
LYQPNHPYNQKNLFNKLKNENPKNDKAQVHFNTKLVI